MLTRFQKLAFQVHLTLNQSRILNLPIFDAIFVRIYFIYKRFEATPVSALNPHIKRGTSVLDIGGGFGFYAKGFARATENPGRVVSFEPDPRNYRRIRRIAEKHSILEVFNVACSDVNGDIGFVTDNLNPANHHVDMNSQYLVPAITLDTWYTSAVPVSLIKIDVQGHEIQVLKGSLNLIRKYFPALLIEIDNRETNEATSEILTTLLRENYQPLRLQDGTFSKTISTAEILEKSGYFDLLFIQLSDSLSQ